MAVHKLIEKFNRITTAEDYSENLGEALNIDDLIFCQNKDYLVLTAPKSLFDLICKIVKLENLKPFISQSEYGRKLEKVHVDYKKSNDEETYFLISGKQMKEIVEKCVAEEGYLIYLFEEIGITTPLDGQPFPKPEESVESKNKHTSLV